MSRRPSPLRLAALFLLLSLLLGCAAAPAPRAPPSEDDPRAVLERFSSAVEARRWDEAYPLLSARWRVRETPSRLASDLAAAGPAGLDAVRRVRALLVAGTAVAVDGEVATLPIGTDRAARLVREDRAWRVDALE
jgi:hypothetical protein